MPATRRPIPPAHRIALGLLIALASWYAMMAVHELGHVLAAWATGGQVQSVSIPLFGFSHTAIHPNPTPQVVTWAGPVLGVLVPLALWAAVYPSRGHGSMPLVERTLRFFAGLALLANGAYLGLGWIDRIGDTDDLLQHGAAVWQLVTFGVVCSTAGLWLWHGLGPWMGLSDENKRS